MQAIKNFRQVGTVTRSGKALSEKIASFITKEDKHVLELGAGDGAITRRILDQMPADGKLLCFEINPKMYATLLEINDPRFHPINDSAEHMEEYMAEHGIEIFDAIAEQNCRHARLLISVIFLSISQCSWIGQLQ